MEGFRKIMHLSLHWQSISAMNLYEWEGEERPVVSDCHTSLFIELCKFSQTSVCQQGRYFRFAARLVFLCLSSGDSCDQRHYVFRLVCPPPFSWTWYLMNSVRKNVNLVQWITDSVYVVTGPRPMPLSPIQFFIKTLQANFEEKKKTLMSYRIMKMNSQHFMSQWPEANFTVRSNIQQKHFTAIS